MLQLKKHLFYQKPLTHSDKQFLLSGMNDSSSKQYTAAISSNFSLKVSLFSEIYG